VKAAFIVSTATALLLSSSAALMADTITLTNGREIYGRFVRETKTALLMRIGGGGILEVKKSDIATYTEDDNIGLDYGKGGVPLEAPKEAKGDGDKEQAGEEKGPEKAGSKEAGDWQSQLPEAAKSLTEKQKKKLLAELEKLRPMSEEYLAATKPSDEEAALIAGYVKSMGYRRKAGNRGRRNVAADNLAKLGLKALPAAVKLLDDANPYQRMSAAKVIAEIAGKDEAWSFYTFHFKLDQTLTKLVGEQSAALSFGIRAEANKCLEGLTGKKTGFEPNNDQFRSRAQAESVRNWQTHFNKARKSYDKSEEKRAKAWEKALKTWKTGKSSKTSKSKKSR